MKRIFSIFLLMFAVLSMAGCGSSSSASASAWSRTGIFTDENNNFLSIAASDDEDYPGWYVNLMLSDGTIYGWVIPQEGSTLHGNLIPEYEEGEFIVTISEEGEDGVALAAEGGETYHFTPNTEAGIGIPEIGITINTEGGGTFTAVSENREDMQTEDYVTSFMVYLSKPEVFTLAAKPDEGWVFVKWMKDGKDFSTEETVSAEFSETAEYTAVFDYPEQ